MSNINAVGSSSLTASYLNATQNAKVDPKKVFQELSIDMGGDGKAITKKQLDSYIAKAKTAKAGTNSTTGDTSGISDNELKGLETMQKNWDKISKGSDSITYSNMSSAANKSILTSMDTADKVTTVDKSADAKEFTKTLNDYIVTSALNTNTNTSSSNNAQSVLKTLLTGTTDENDDSNAELIAKLTNIIADSKKAKSTVETEA